MLADLSLRKGSGKSQTQKKVTKKTIWGCQDGKHPRQYVREPLRLADSAPDLMVDTESRRPLTSTQNLAGGDSEGASTQVSPQGPPEVIQRHSTTPRATTRENRAKRHNPCNQGREKQINSESLTTQSNAQENTKEKQGRETGRHGGSLTA